MLSTLVLLFAAVGILSALNAECSAVVALGTAEVSIHSFHSGGGPCDTC